MGSGPILSTLCEVIFRLLGRQAGALAATACADGSQSRQWPRPSRGHDGRYWQLAPEGHEKIAAELRQKYHEPWMDQNVRYGDFIVITDALENSGKAVRKLRATAPCRR
jgi:hypothetical protein